MENANKKLFLDAIAKITRLNTSPAILVKVEIAMWNEMCTMDEIIAILRTDASLTSEILRVSNSSYYSIGTPAKDLNGALSRIGFAKVRRIVSTSVLSGLSKREMSNYGIKAQNYWNISIAAAVLMEALGKHINGDIEEAYTIGILHCVGRMVISDLINHFKIDMFWDECIPINEWEECAVGFNYGVAGAQLLKAWNFPDTFVETIHYHIDPTQCQKPLPLMLALHFTVNLITQIGSDLARPFDATLFNLPLAKHYHLNSEVLTEIINDARAHLLTLQESLK